MGAIYIWMEQGPWTPSSTGSATPVAQRPGLMMIDNIRFNWDPYQGLNIYR